MSAAPIKKPVVAAVRADSVADAHRDALDDGTSDAQRPGAW